MDTTFGEKLGEFVLFCLVIMDNSNYGRCFTRTEVPIVTRHHFICAVHFGKFCLYSRVSILCFLRMIGHQNVTTLDTFFFLVRKLVRNSEIEQRNKGMLI